MPTARDDRTRSPKGSMAKSVALAAAFAAVGAFAGPRLLGTGAADAAGAGAAAGATTTTAPGPTVVLDAVTLNLADGHLLQVGLALELSHEAAGGSGHGEAADDDPTKGYARALDAAIAVFGDRSMAVLSEPGGRHQAKADLEQALGELYNGAITGVYFHQFVMQ